MSFGRPKDIREPLADGVFLTPDSKIPCIEGMIPTEGTLTEKFNTKEESVGILRFLEYGDNPQLLDSENFPELYRRWLMEDNSSAASLTEVLLEAGVDPLAGQTIGTFEAMFAYLDIPMVNIPDNIRTLGVCTFWGCEKLHTVWMAPSVEVIHPAAFLRCTDLENVTLNTGLTKIEEQVFSECPKLTKVTYGGTMDQWALVEKAGGWCDATLLEVDCADGVIKI